MNDIPLEFTKKFSVEELKIYETEYWIWSLRPHQVTVGAGILSLKRESSFFSDLNEEEFKDLGNIIKVIENTLKSLFNYDVMNYLMLMMIDKHVHYHVIPRYKNKISFLDKWWYDESWPAPPNLAGTNNNEIELNDISTHIKSNLIKK